MSILGLKFRDYGQVYYFDSGPFVVNDGDRVIVNTDQGMSLGRVVLIKDPAPEQVSPEEIKPIYRLATAEDAEKIQENEDLAREAFSFCRKCIQEHKLEMKLVDVEVFFDRSKIIFYFTAPNRIDFRELVKDLVKAYRTRIELRQIGVRHETQMIGAVGNCGQVCCCRRFLRKFAPVTIKMAKEQNLFLNPTKISGICGRLLCCLSYEQEMYEDFRRKCPKVGKKYLTGDGAAKVLRANLFRKSLTILMENGEEREVDLDEWATLDPRRPDQPREQAALKPRPKPVRTGEGRDAPSEEDEASQARPKGRPRDRDRGRDRGRERFADKPQDGIPEVLPASLPALREEPRDSIPTYDVQRVSAYFREQEQPAQAPADAPKVAGAGAPESVPGDSSQPKPEGGEGKRSGRRGRRRKKKTKKTK